MIEIANVEKELFAYILSIDELTEKLGERIFCNYVPARISLPTLCIFYVDKIYLQSHDGYDELITIRLQFNSYAFSKSEAIEIADVVKRIFVGSFFTTSYKWSGHLVDELDVFEEKIKNYVVKTDIKFLIEEV